MKTIKVKTVCGDNHAYTTLTHPMAPLGDNHDASVQTRQINNIPDGISNADVVRLFSLTADVSYLYGQQRLEFDYKELGVGRIIR